MQQLETKEFLISHYNEVVSTQDELKSQIDNGVAKTGIAVSADVQTAGRGRYDRNWSTESGNMAVSYCLALDDKPNPELLCYVAGVSMHETLKQLGVHYLELKWVNDVLVAEKKIAGILLEGYKGFIIVGVGCNVKSFAEMDDLNATSLESEGVEVTNIELVERFSADLNANLVHYRNYGFAKFKNYWLEHAFKLGEEININLPDDEQKAGVFKTIDDNGKLVLEIDGICHSMSAGELFDL